MYVLLHQIAQLFQDQLHSLTPNNKKTKKKNKKNSQRCRYARLQPVYCQLIVLTSNILSLAKSLIGIGMV